MSFKIAGVATGSSKGPYKKGEVIPLADSEKLIVQCKDEISKRADEGFANLVTDAIVVGETHTTKGKGLKFNDPNHYSGRVKITYKPLDLLTDRLHKEIVDTFDIQITDSTDDLGVDDLTTIVFNKV